MHIASMHVLFYCADGIASSLVITFVLRWQCCLAHETDAGVHYSAPVPMMAIRGQLCPMLIVYPAYSHSLHTPAC